MLLSCTSFLSILEINPLPDVWFANVFPHSAVFFMASIVPAAARELWVWCRPFVDSCFCPWAGVMCTESLLTPNQEAFPHSLLAVLRFQGPCFSLPSIFGSFLTSSFSRTSAGSPPLSRVTRLARQAPDSLSPCPLLAVQTSKHVVSEDE